GRGGVGGGADTPAANLARVKATTTRTAYYIGEGVQGCFKDSILCGVQFEPSLAAVPTDEDPRPGGKEDAGSVSRGDEEEVTLPAGSGGEKKGRVGGGRGGQGERYLVMGPSGLPEDVVARGKGLPQLEPGDWLYFTRMGAYTTSI
ncbi:unnamed protein product, partial [Discosporangium mesarthrocarpum]